MAPSRKRGASKAAAAAAARRKWMVGDLVLAKLKGYPAWPATVSEPEKWDQSADRKKVFVHFFGTKQIAFCHPVDVEEFTEEKKASLLGKRHGKGADFIRAVKEITDCFDNVKQRDEVSSIDGTEETSITTDHNTKESLTKSEKNVAPAVTVKSHAIGTANDLNSLSEAAAAAAAEDDLHHEEMQMEVAPSNILFTETPMSATYPTRSRTDVVQSQNGTQRRISARKLRRSSGADASRVQNLMFPSVNGTRSSRRSGYNSLCDRSLRRSKRFMKSSDDSEGHDSDSPSSPSNNSGEENDSGTMTVDSDIHSLNDSSSVESGCKPVETEVACDNNDEETELGDRLDFQNKTVIIKKKRKPSRKRHNTDTVVAAKPNVVLKPECVSPINNEKMVKRPKDDGDEHLPLVKRPKDDGDLHLPLVQRPKNDDDEHLPLVKRSRIRMGRPSLAEEQENVTVHKEEKVSVLGTQLSGSLNCNENVPADGNSVAKGDPPNFTLSRQSPPKKPQFWESRKNCVDGEAALPPSKRLQRALEAMSANLAENGHRTSSCSPTVNTHSNEYSFSFSESSELTMEKKPGTGSGPVENHNSGDSQSIASFCVGSNSELSGSSAKTFAVVSDCGKTCSIDSSDSELNKDSYEHNEGTGSKRLESSLLNGAKIVDVNQQTKLSPLNEHPTKIVRANQHVKPGSPSSCEEMAHLDCNKCGLVISPTASCKIEGLELNKNVEGPDPEIYRLSISAALVEEIAGGSLDMGIDTQTTHFADKGCETHKKKYSPFADTDQASQRFESKEEVKLLSMHMNDKPSPIPVKALTSSYRRSLFHTDTVSDKTCSIAKASPPSSSMRIISQSNSNNYNENSVSCSSNVQLHLEKAKLAGKSSSKVESLSSFEAAIRSLTRTKESIGRATRIAIDCAKFGFATKIMEILARNLERESSSHKKVDLFFLVDSITQFSRGVKGDGGVYPSAIQALLPRLLLAAAPPGSGSHENHRQCLKVLRVWQERKIIPEPLIRHHIQELDALCGSYPTGGSRRSLRNERAFDDPIREMEGMLVDEYGSNSSFQLPGFCMPPMLRDDDIGTDSDGESFEAVTPEHNIENTDVEKTPIPAVEKRSHILEDVDGELEMEDVAPCCEVEMTSTDNITGTDSMQLPHQQPDKHYEATFAPQQSNDIQLAFAPLPKSLPPPPPPPPHPSPPSVFPPAECDSMANGPESKRYTSSQNFNGNVRESVTKHSVFPRTKQTTMNSTHHRTHDYRNFEAHVPRQMLDGIDACFNDQTPSHLSGPADGIHQADSSFSKGFHLRPPHPALSNQFSYVQEQRSQSQRDMPPPPHPNRLHTRYAETGNFYRDRDRHKFTPRDNIGECWRPPLPPISGPCYEDGGRMPHASTAYGGPPRELAAPNNRWNYRPRSMNHRHFNPYRPPSDGHIPVANRGPFWRPG